MFAWKRAFRPAVVAAAALGMSAAALVALPAANAATGDGSPSDSNITYVGRWDRSNPAAYDANWAGAYLRVGFTGTSVKLRQRNSVDLYVSIDGAPFEPYPKVVGTLDLTPTRLAAGNHTLVVAYKQVAGGYRGDDVFQGLVLDPGASTFALPKRPKLVEFIGDSITAGATSSLLALTDYAWVAGERIGVEHTQIAAGGWCLVQTPDNCSGHEQRYFLTSGLAGTAAWDFSRYRADAVVINLGTNDRSHGVSGPDFQAKYTTFLRDIRAKYPNAALIGLRTFIGRYAAETRAAVQARNAAGDPNVFYVDTTGWLPPSGLTDSVHPNDAGHRAIAEKLAPVLTAHLANGPTTPPTTPPAAGTVKLVNRHSGKVIAPTSTAAGAAVVQTADTNAAIQQWSLVDAGGGYAKLVNRASGLLLDVNGKSTADGAVVLQYRDTGGTNQHWQVVTNGSHRRLVNRNSGKVLDVFGGATNDGAAVIQWADNGGANQQWTLPGA